MARLSAIQIKLAAKAKRALMGSEYEHLITKSTRFKKNKKTGNWMAKFANGIVIDIAGGRLWINDPKTPYHIPWFKL